MHFRHITEITILTVQLIVEFAKGLPAFTKIPQEDQITLLKVNYTKFPSQITFFCQSCHEPRQCIVTLLH